MGIFVEKTSTFEVEVFYVFDKEGEAHVITEEDVEYISKSDEEKKEIYKDYDALMTSSVPFNVAIESIMDYSKSDIRKLNFTFRKMNFQDTSRLLSSMSSSSGVIAPKDVIDFNNKKMEMLFQVGFAEVEDGSKVKITKSNLGTLSPALGNAIALKLV